jgi:hypothetical protein
MSPASRGESWAATARDLYLVAMAVLLVTVSIGVVNGLDLVAPSHDVLLTHVHSGTLGWLSLGIVATAGWLYRASDRRMAVALIILVPIYVAAFASGNLAAKAIGGVLLLAAILWLVVWAWRSFLASERSVPGLALVLALTTFTYGAIIGVLLQVQFAIGAIWLSGDAIGSHAGAMVFAYLVLAAMGIVEWRLRETRGRPRGGVVQVAALFVGGLVLSLGLLVGAAQAAGGIYLLVTLIAIVLFTVRVVPAAVRAPWADPGPGRQFAAASLWIVVAVAIYLYLVSQFITSGGDTAAINLNVLVASDHATFIGVMTNVLLGLVATIAPIRRSAPSWLHYLQFWAMNLGLAAFAIGLIVDSAVIKRLGAPVMGIAILLGLALLAPRLWASRGDPAPADA